jgi:hypothetical protein
MGDLVTVSR